MVELDVPAMVHVSSSCNPNFHATGAHYINADTTAFMQFLTADLFKDFPTLRFIIPHGGGAVPYHWGRYRGLAQDMKRPLLERLRAEECVLRYLRLSPAGHRAAAQGHSRGQHLFGSEMVGAVRGIDPRDRPILRRHQALPGCARSERRRPLQDIRGQCAQGVPAPRRRIEPSGAPSEALAPAEALGRRSCRPPWW